MSRVYIKDMVPLVINEDVKECFSRYRLEKDYLESKISEEKYSTYRYCDINKESGITRDMVRQDIRESRESLVFWRDCTDEAIENLEIVIFTSFDRAYPSKRMPKGLFAAIVKHLST